MSLQDWEIVNYIFNNDVETLRAKVPQENYEVVCHYAVLQGNSDLYKEFFTPQPDGTIGNHFSIACRVGSVPIVKFLYEEKDLIRGSPMNHAYWGLHSAISGGQIDVAKFLFEKGETVDLNFCSPNYLLFRKFYESVEFLESIGVEICKDHMNYEDYLEFKLKRNVN